MCAEDLTGETGRLVRYNAWRKMSAAMAAKKAGVPIDAAALKPRKKLQRTKTYVAMQNLNNIVYQASGSSLDRYQIIPNSEGVLPSPFSWPHLSVASDRGPDCVCMDHAFRFKFGLNITTEWDLSHSTHNSCKAALKQCGLWSHETVVVSIGNLMYGSMLSPGYLSK